MTGKPGGEEDEETPTPDDRPAGDRVSDVGDNLMPEDVREQTREQQAGEQQPGEGQAGS